MSFGSGGGVFWTRRSHSDEERLNERRAGGEDAGGALSLSLPSCAVSDGVKGVMFSGVSAGVVRSEGVAEVVVKRVSQLEHVAAPDGFMVPQMGQRTSVDGASRAAQFLQNLLLGLFWVPHCGQ